MTRESEKALAADAASQLVEDRMTVGLGSGTTIGHFLPALARRSLDIRCIASSPATEHAARVLGLQVEEFGSIDRVDLAIDGADQVAPDFWLLKGGGAAHTREKIVAASAERFVVIVDSSKIVDSLRPPVPIEVMAFGLAATLLRLGQARRRDGPFTPDGGVIVDLEVPLVNPPEVAAWLSGTPGVIEHGLFSPGMVSGVLIGIDDKVEFRERNS